jgi:glycosyltransferase involved in cell wall biosynthesis
MSISVLEALGSGTPVVSTDVGEVRRVVQPGVSGRVVAERSATALAEGMNATLAETPRLAGRTCVEAVAPYTAPRVLEPIYENYRRIAHAGRLAR